MLLVGAGLLIRSYVQLQQVEPGFEPEGVTTFSLSLPAARYSDPASPRAFVSALLSRLKAEPGVESAAVAMGLPFTSDLQRHDWLSSRRAGGAGIGIDADGLDADRQP